jgi:acetyl-CoA acetyltransferase family protein
MTRGPWVISKTSSAFGRDAQMFDSSFGWRFINPKMEAIYGVDSMGMTAENLAGQFDISRADQDAFACWSQEKTAKATGSGYFEGEITPVSIPQRKGEPKIIATDEFARPSTSIESLAGLRPAFKKDGSVTAGNASGLNDGAAALLMASEDGLKIYGLTPMVRMVSAAVAGVEPRIMGIGPVDAIPKAIKMAGLSLNDINLFELNEAFASQALAVIRETGINPDLVNVNGGAIALGHPLGCTGAKLSVQIMNELKKRQQKYGIVTMCVGTGQGAAGVIEMM